MTRAQTPAPELPVYNTAPPRDGTGRPGVPAAAVRRRGHRESLAGYLFLSPWCIGILLLTLGPMLFSLYLSFTEYNLFDAPRWVGMQNFERMFDDERWWRAVRVTTVFVLIATPVKLAAALGVALLLVKPRTGQGFYRSAFYAPSLIGASVSVGIVWRAIFSEGAIVDRGTDLLGMDTGGWIGDPAWSMPTLVALAVWQFGAPMVIFLAGLKQVPRELYEAAEVDGASARRRFLHITLPLISPVIFFNLLLEIIHSFQIFTSALVIAGPGGGQAGGPGGSLLVYTWYLYEQGFQRLSMGYASAMAWMLLVGIAVVTIILFRSQRHWVHYEEDAR